MPKASGLLAALVCLAAAAPSDLAERDVAALAERLQAHRALWPYAVDDALRTLGPGVAVDIDCPGEPLPPDVESLEGGRRVLPAQTVRVLVSTRRAPWDPRRHGREGRDGEYEWRLPQGYGADGKRDEVRADNELALSPRVLALLRSPSAGAWTASLVLLYHELLHAQLMIDAMRGDPQWRGDFCRFFRDEDADRRILAAGDPAHVRVPSLERQFRRALERAFLGGRGRPGSRD